MAAVAPRAGAWIETGGARESSRGRWSPLAQGPELKPHPRQTVFHGTHTGFNGPSFLSPGHRPRLEGEAAPVGGTAPSIARNRGGRAGHGVAAKRQRRRVSRLATRGQSLVGTGERSAAPWRPFPAPLRRFQGRCDVSRHRYVLGSDRDLASQTLTLLRWRVTAFLGSGT